MTMYEGNRGFLMLVSSTSNLKKRAEHILVVARGQEGVTVHADGAIPEKLETCANSLLDCLDSFVSIAHYIMTLWNAGLGN
jgi:hypothetical protein